MAVQPNRESTDKGEWHSPIKTKSVSRRAQASSTATSGTTATITSAARRLFSESVSDKENGSIDSLTPEAPCRLLSCKEKKFATPQLSHVAADLVTHLNIRVQLTKDLQKQKAIYYLLTGIIEREFGETLLAELGIALFYLDRDHALPCESFLVAHRAQEIENEVNEYIEDHKSATKSPLIPSGKTHYLMRAFTHMTLTSKGTYNPGGLFAIKHILSNPRYHVALHLQPEHHEHILIVVEQMLSQEAFNDLFALQPRVHPDLQEVIWLDLKLKPQADLPSYYIFYACLLALFSDVRQADTPNCYAISALIYMTENHTYKAFKMMIDLLASGRYEIAPNVWIPLRPYLESHFDFREDLEIEVLVDEKTTLPCLDQISSALQLSMQPKPSKWKMTPIRAFLSEKSATSHPFQQLTYAEKLFHAYKVNVLTILQLKVLECVSANITYEFPFAVAKVAKDSVGKDNLINACLTGLETWAQGKDIPDEVWERVESRLRSSLWFECVGEAHVKVEKDVVIGGSEVVRNFKGKAKALADLYRGSKRVYHLQGNKYTRLSSFTDLQRAIKSEIVQVCDDLEQKGINCSQAKKVLSTGALSDLFKGALALYAEKQIDIQGIRENDLIDSDLLILKNRGGFTNTVLEHAYGIVLYEAKVTGCSTPAKFFEKISTLLQSWNISRLHNTHKILMFNNNGTPDDHIWTISPNCWKFAFTDAQQLPIFVQQSIVERGEAFLKNKIPEATLQRVIERYTKDPQERTEMLVYFLENKNLSYKALKDTLVNSVKREERDRIVNMIDEEFWKVTLTPPLLEKVMQILNLEGSASLNFMLTSLPNEASYPHVIANNIRIFLNKQRITITQPLQIEVAICQALGLPLPFELGDLNWMDNRREDPSHIHLMIMYSFGLEALSYYVREPQTQKIDTSSRYENLHLLVPLQSLI